jgi:hypothetical protein
LEEREKEMKERMYEVNMRETRKQYGQGQEGWGRESVDKNTTFFSEMSNYDIHKP